uniref:Uncharacterized protein n=2 Tax=Picea TaxID=3328 RepID=A0A117NJB4_PICGL|nr:hypothetical protein ABT39_MTgene1031 [Picea glauca]QHR90048.1 hypothetical protein Q903MT_gene4071 [Picea sitchensis]
MGGRHLPSLFISLRFFRMDFDEQVRGSVRSRGPTATRYHRLIEVPLLLGTTA